MNGAITRILLRWLAAFLVARGYFSDDLASSLLSDPDIQIAAGAVIGMATEGWYAAAKRFGWNT